MMTHDDIDDLITDYVLGLLSSQEQSEVEGHLATCFSCLQNATKERQIAREVRSALHVMTQPEPLAVRRLMPAPPPARPGRARGRGWPRQLAPALLIVLLVVATFFLQAPETGRELPGFITTAHAATATTMQTPTATVLQPPTTVAARTDASAHAAAVQQAPVTLPAGALIPPHEVETTPAPTPAVALLSRGTP